MNRQKFFEPHKKRKKILKNPKNPKEIKKFSTSTASLPQMNNITNIASSSTLNASPSFEDEAIVQCPTCDAKLHRYEVAKHCEEEMQRLKELQTHALKESRIKPEDDDGNQPEVDEAGRSTSNGQSSSEKRKPWTVFQRVQRNRQSRMKQRNRKRPLAPEHPCPVCNLNFPQDEIQQHAEDCLRRSRRTANGRSNSDEHSSNDDDDVGGGGEEYEEYEWAGQKRIRVSSLLQGGYAAIGIGQPLTNGSSVSSGQRLNGYQDEDEDDEDLNVDEDDTQIYGPAQYGESDVIPSHIINEDESDVTSYMRRLITNGSSSHTQLVTNLENTQHHSHNDNLSSPQHVLGGSEMTTTTTSAVTSAASVVETNTETAVQPSTPAHYQQIIDSLKAKLRHYEQQHVPGKYKCLICLDDYRNPAISVACWHVHCEQCWLRSLGARKLFKYQMSTIFKAYLYVSKYLTTYIKINKFLEKSKEFIKKIELKNILLTCQEILLMQFNPHSAADVLSNSLAAGGSNTQPHNHHSQPHHQPQHHQFSNHQPPPLSHTLHHSHHPGQQHFERSSSSSSTTSTTYLVPVTSSHLPLDSTAFLSSPHFVTSNPVSLSSHSASNTSTSSYTFVQIKREPCQVSEVTTSNTNNHHHTIGSIAAAAASSASSSLSSLAASTATGSLAAAKTMSSSTLTTLVKIEASSPKVHDMDKTHLNAQAGSGCGVGANMVNSTNNTVPIGIAVARKRPQETTAPPPPAPPSLTSSSTLPLSQPLNKDMNCFGIRHGHSVPPPLLIPPSALKMEEWSSADFMAAAASKTTTTTLTAAALNVPQPPPPPPPAHFDHRDKNSALTTTHSATNLLELSAPNTQALNLMRLPTPPTSATIESAAVAAAVSAAATPSHLSTQLLFQTATPSPTPTLLNLSATINRVTAAQSSQNSPNVTTTLAPLANTSSPLNSTTTGGYINCPNTGSTTLTANIGPPTPLADDMPVMQFKTNTHHLDNSTSPQIVVGVPRIVNPALPNSITTSQTHTSASAPPQMQDVNIQTDTPVCSEDENSSCPLNSTTACNGVANSAATEQCTTAQCTPPLTQNDELYHDSEAQQPLELTKPSPHNNNCHRAETPLVESSSQLLRSEEQMPILKSPIKQQTAAQLNETIEEQQQHNLPPNEQQQHSLTPTITSSTATPHTNPEDLTGLELLSNISTSTLAKTVTIRVKQEPLDTINESTMCHLTAAEQQPMMESNSNHMDPQLSDQPNPMILHADNFPTPPSPQPQSPTLTQHHVMSTHSPVANLAPSDDVEPLGGLKLLCALAEQRIQEEEEVQSTSMNNAANGIFRPPTANSSPQHFSSSFTQNSFVKPVASTFSPLETQNTTFPSLETLELPSTSSSGNCFSAHITEAVVQESPVKRKKHKHSKSSKSSSSLNGLGSGAGGSSGSSSKKSQKCSKKNKKKYSKEKKRHKLLAEAQQNDLDFDDPQLQQELQNAFQNCVDPSLQRMGKWPTPQEIFSIMENSMRMRLADITRQYRKKKRKLDEISKNKKNKKKCSKLQANQQISLVGNSALSLAASERSSSSNAVVGPTTLSSSPLCDYKFGKFTTKSSSTSATTTSSNYLAPSSFIRFATDANKSQNHHHLNTHPQFPPPPDLELENDNTTSNIPTNSTATLIYKPVRLEPSSLDQRSITAAHCVGASGGTSNGVLRLAQKHASSEKHSHVIVCKEPKLSSSTSSRRSSGNEDPDQEDDDVDEEAEEPTAANDDNDNLDEDDMPHNRTSSDNEMSKNVCVAKPRKMNPIDRSLMLTQDHLYRKETRVLTDMGGLFYEGIMKPLQPPDVYAITLDGGVGTGCGNIYFTGNGDLMTSSATADELALANAASLQNALPIESVISMSPATVGLQYSREASRGQVVLLPATATPLDPFQQAAAAAFVWPSYIPQGTAPATLQPPPNFIFPSMSPHSTLQAAAAAQPYATSLQLLGSNYLTAAAAAAAAAAATSTLCQHNQQTNSTSSSINLSLGGSVSGSSSGTTMSSSSSSTTTRFMSLATTGGGGGSINDTAALNVPQPPPPPPPAHFDHRDKNSALTTTHSATNLLELSAPNTQALNLMRLPTPPTSATIESAAVAAAVSAAATPSHLSTQLLFQTATPSPTPTLLNLSATINRVTAAQSSQNSPNVTTTLAPLANTSSPLNSTTTGGYINCPNTGSTTLTANIGPPTPLADDMPVMQFKTNTHHLDNSTSPQIVVGVPRIVNPALPNSITTSQTHTSASAPPQMQDVNIQTDTPVCSEDENSSCPLNSTTACNGVANSAATEQCTTAQCTPPLTQNDELYHDSEAQQPLELTKPSPHNNNCHRAETPLVESSSQLLRSEEQMPILKSPIKQQTAAQLNETIEEQQQHILPPNEQQQHSLTPTITSSTATPHTNPEDLTGLELLSNISTSTLAKTVTIRVKQEPLDTINESTMCHLTAAEQQPMMESNSNHMDPQLSDQPNPMILHADNFPTPPSPQPQSPTLTQHHVMSTHSPVANLAPSDDVEPLGGLKLLCALAEQRIQEEEEVQSTSMNNAANGIFRPPTANSSPQHFSSSFTQNSFVKPVASTFSPLETQNTTFPSLETLELPSTSSSGNCFSAHITEAVVQESPVKRKKHKHSKSSKSSSSLNGLGSGAGGSSGSSSKKSQKCSKKNKKKYSKEKKRHKLLAEAQQNDLDFDDPQLQQELQNAFQNCVDPSLQRMGKWPTPQEIFSIMENSMRMRLADITRQYRKKKRKLDEISKNKKNKKKCSKLQANQQISLVGNSALSLAASERSSSSNAVVGPTTLSSSPLCDYKFGKFTTKSSSTSATTTSSNYLAPSSFIRFATDANKSQNHHHLNTHPQFPPPPDLELENDNTTSNIPTNSTATLIYKPVRLEPSSLDQRSITAAHCVGASGGTSNGVLRLAQKHASSEKHSHVIVCKEPKLSSSTSSRRSSGNEDPDQEDDDVDEEAEEPTAANDDNDNLDEDDIDDMPHNRTSSDNEMSKNVCVAKPRKMNPIDRSLMLTQDHLYRKETRVLTDMGGLFYAGIMKPLQPPDVYAITLDGERGNKSHIMSREEIFKDTILEMAPKTVEDVPVGTRLCAYWSQQYRCLYPGRAIESESSDDGVTSQEFVSVEFDDGDSGRIRLQNIRLLLSDYPQVGWGLCSIFINRTTRSSLHWSHRIDVGKFMVLYLSPPMKMRMMYKRYRIVVKFYNLVVIIINLDRIQSNINRYTIIMIHII
ncbi:Protein winged eye [Lucilia cuprina]|nr:Protein winged eye [Lucilia cuprina]